MTKRGIRKRLLASIPFETERLIIRYINLNDAYDMFEYAQIPEVSEYLLWSPHLNVEATEGYIEFLQKRYTKGLYADWAIVLKDDGKMIGTCGFANIDSSNKTCEIGYVLSPKYQGKGYMTEAITELLSLTFEKLDFNESVLRIIKENKKSIKLAEKLGFEFSFGVNMEIKELNREVLHYKLTKEKYFGKKNEAVL